MVAITSATTASTFSCTVSEERGVGSGGVGDSGGGAVGDSCINASISPDVAVDASPVHDTAATANPTNSTKTDPRAQNRI